MIELTLYGQMYGQAHREDVGLALDRDELLVEAALERASRAPASTSPACTTVIA